MKKLGCAQVVLIFLALGIVMSVILYMIINPAVQSMTEDIVIKGLGKYQETKVYSKNNVNYTCYRQYKFESIDTDNVENSQYLTKINAENIEILREFEADFSNRVKKNAMEGYSFDMSMVDEGDYGYIYFENDPTSTGDGDRKYAMYNIYLLDSRTKTIHKLEYKQDLYK